MAELEKVIRGLECCLNTGNFEECTENCPYFTKKLGMGVCSENMQRDALSLLKAQEPRVMTLEEVVEHAKLPLFECSEKAPVYIEYYITRPTYVKWLNVETLNIWLNDDRKYYNKAIVFGWRCWTSRPTDEQRKKVKWE